MAYYVGTMSQSNELIPFSVEPSDDFAEWTDDIIGTLTPQGRSLELALGDFEETSGRFDELIVRLHREDVDEAEGVGKQVVKLHDDFRKLIAQLAPEAANEVTTEHNLAVAKLIAALTCDRGMLLQAVTGVDLFVNLSESEIIDGTMSSLEYAQALDDYRGIDVEALLIFKCLFDDQIRNFDNVPVLTDAPIKTPPTQTALTRLLGRLRSPADSSRSRLFGTTSNK